MKTTLNLDDSLLANAKVLAAQQRTTLTRLIEEALQQRLQNAAKAPRGKVVLPVIKGHGGLMPGIDPLSNRSLFEAAGDP